jgi:hypothetical protein
MNFGIYVYVTAHIHTLSIKSTRRYMLEHSNLHRQCIILHYFRHRKMRLIVHSSLVLLKRNIENHKTQIKSEFQL